MINRKRFLPIWHQNFDLDFDLHAKISISAGVLEAKILVLVSVRSRLVSLLPLRDLISTNSNLGGLSELCMSARRPWLDRENCCGLPTRIASA